MPVFFALPVSFNFGKNSTFQLGLKTLVEKAKAPDRKIGGEAAQRIVDFAAKDGLTYAESRYLSGLKQDSFSGRGEQVVDRFLAANPTPPPSDGPQRVARTQRVIDYAAADGKISFLDVQGIRNTFDELEVTPETLSQQRDAVQKLIDRPDLKFASRPGPFGSQSTARDELAQLIKTYGG